MYYVRGQKQRILLIVYVLKGKIENKGVFYRRPPKQLSYHNVADAPFSGKIGIKRGNFTLKIFESHFQSSMKTSKIGQIHLSELATKWV